MADYPFGAPVDLTLDDANGNPAVLANYAEVVLTIIQPDATSLTKTKTGGTLNANPYIFQPTQTGLHFYYYVTTTPNGATEPQPFNVETAGVGGLVSLADVKTYIGQTGTSYDDRLQTMIEAASTEAENIIGPVRRKVVTGEVHNGGWPTISLYYPPVLSVETVTEYVGTTFHTLTNQPPGSTTDSYGYSLDDPDSGILLRRSAAGTPMAFMGGGGNIVVSYTSGRVSVPPTAAYFCKELVRHWWVRGQASGTDEYGAAPMPGGVPQNLIDLLTRRVWGIA